MIGQAEVGYRHAVVPLGVLLWAVLAIGSLLGFLRLDTIEVLYLLGPLAIVPLGMQLLQQHASGGIPNALRHCLSVLMPTGALLVVFSFFSSSRLVAASLCGLWLLFAGLGAIAGILRIVRHKPRGIGDLSFLAAQLYLPVGAGWLILSRLGTTPLGFAEPIVLLTAVHFHFAGFAAAILAGETVRRARDTGGAPLILRLAAAGIVLAPALIASGFVFSKPLQLFGVLLSSASLVVFAACVFWLLPRIPRNFARVLLGISAGTVPVGMTFAAVYAIGMFQNELFVSIPRMAAFHGVLNGLGFSLCGLLAWNLLAQVERRPK